MNKKIYDVKIELCNQEIIAQVVAEDWQDVCNEIFGSIQIIDIDEEDEEGGNHG